MTQFDQAKTDAFHLTDAEVEKLHQLTVPLIKSVHHEFGSRTTQALINPLAAQLSMWISQGGEDSFYIIDKVNEWFAVLALNGGGLPLHITFDDELAAELREHSSK